jgi:hypothetical protein
VLRDHLARTVEDPESEQQCQCRALKHTRAPSSMGIWSGAFTPPRMDRAGHRRFPEIGSASGVPGYHHTSSHLVSITR